MTEPATKSASFRAFLPLLRYGRRYSGRAFLALAALTTSAAATLAVPFALRRMIDFGFSKDAGGASTPISWPWARLSWSSRSRLHRAIISSRRSASGSWRTCAATFSPI